MVAVRSVRRRRYTPAERLALEIREILDRYDLERPYAVMYWSAYRAREPLLDALRHSWDDWTFGELTALEPTALAHAHAFFDDLRHFRLWARFTDAMPATLERRLDEFEARARPLAERAVEALGGVPEVEARDQQFPEGWASLVRDPWGDAER